VLLDRLGGGIAERVAAQATPSAAEATRWGPYNKYLRWELATFPLPPPWDLTMPARVAADPGELFPEVAALARRCGHGDVLDSWGDDLALLGVQRGR
jgi:hypothetical protein